MRHKIRSMEEWLLDDLENGIPEHRFLKESQPMSLTYVHSFAFVILS